MPQPRSRKEVAGLERPSGEVGEAEWEERKARSLASASESSNQTVPSSSGLVEWFVNSVA